MTIKLFAAFGLVLMSSSVMAQDAADLVVRTGRLENQVRQLSGQLEQVQFENRQLKDQLRKFQEDVEVRFSEQRGGSRPPAASQPPAMAPPVKRSDGVPSGAKSSPSIAGLIAEEQDGPTPLDLNSVGKANPPKTSTSIAATGTGDARADYEAAYAYLLQKQYEQAEMGFRQFIQSHPRARLAPDAAYWLGETYFQRNRHREGAEQFLKVTTDHASAAKAPDAMLRLGQSLSALGAKEQACSTFAELGRKYPQASPGVRQGSEREMTRNKCG
jgi:tol-pal system protein YbgF